MTSLFPSLRSVSERRTVWLAVAALLVALPAALLISLCPGDICGRSDQAAPRVPFCSLSEDLRRSVRSGHREGRAPDVFVVTGRRDIRGGSHVLARSAPPWPSRSRGSAEMPLGFWGEGVATGLALPEGVTLDSVAPTLAAIAGVKRPHPEVRSGEAIDRVASGDPPRLLVLLVWKDISSADLRRSEDAWLELQAASRRGAFTDGAVAGSQPLDPAALLTTIGTGGLPHQHGIIGSALRSDSGAIVPAWGPRAPLSVIAALGDDLDESSKQDARVGLVGTRRFDRGLIGGNWYVEQDTDDVRLLRRGPAAQAQVARSLLEGGYGDDDVTDLLAVALEGEDVAALDEATAAIARAAESAAGGSVAFAHTGIGSDAPRDPVPAADLATAVERAVGAEVIEAEAVGGFFLDQNALIDAKLSQDDIVRAVRDSDYLRGGDVFTSTAIELARYC